MDCPEEKKSKDSTGKSSGGFAMMCVESPVEEDSEQRSAHHSEQPNLEVVGRKEFGSASRSTAGTNLVTTRLE